MSDIRGTGYGSSHNWKRKETTPNKVTQYECECGARFAHAYDVIPDIFEAMHHAGVVDKCPKSYTVTDRRGVDKEEPRLPCRVCGSSVEHSREYNKPTMDCVLYLRQLIVDAMSKPKGIRNGECPKCGNENGLISSDTYPSRITCGCGNVWWGY